MLRQYAQSKVRLLLASGASIVLSAACFPGLDGLTGSGDGSGTDGSVSKDGGKPPVATPCGPESFCRAAAPSGWEGPGTLRSDPAEGPPCSQAPFVISASEPLLDALVVAPTTCPCSCGTPSTECTYTATVFGAAGCAGAVKRTATLVTNQCDVNTDFSESMRITGTEKKAGSCVPTGSTTAPPLQWGFQGHFCAGSFYAGSCSAGNVCVAGNEQVCVVRTGDVPCPGSPYTKRRLVYRGATDTRACTACTCGAPVGGCTSPPLQNHLNVSNGTCINPGGIIKADTTGCYDGIQWYKPGHAGSCPAIPGTPTGAVVPSQPVTVCCESSD